jgi:hypothetical protein
MIAPLPIVRTRSVSWWASLDGLVSDGVLYATSALFAIVLGWTSNQPAQWQWGYLAAGSYSLVALIAFALSRLKVRRALRVRIGLLVLVILGSMAIPLGLEARWRQLDHGVGYAQPEVSVIERSGKYLSQGLDVYHSYVLHGHLINPVKGLPTYESFFPYFPLMGLFGLPSAETNKSKGLTDARIVMSLMTLLVSLSALALMRAGPDKKIRVAQVLLALPSGALFLATGGDDMPILAFMLLGTVALQRRRSNLAGISLGVAAAMKLTAWPLALGALLVARDGDDRRSWRRLGAWMLAIILVTVVPFVVRSPWAFMSNVFAFPLGLAGIASPAASALPGHVLTTMWSPLGHVLAPLTLLVGGYFATRYVRRSWPLELSQLLGLLAITFAVMICVASATRIGYVIYPLNFALWSTVIQEDRVLTPLLV